MKKRTLITGLGVLALVLALSLTNAYAMHGKEGSMHGGKGHSGCMMSGEKGGELEGMFFMKAHVILKNSEELGLTEEKVAAIKQLVLETKKSLIKQNAEIEVAGLDFMAKLHENPIDTAVVDKLVDQKYELKKAKTKSLVQALATLKGSLEKEQYDKLRQLWKKGEKQEGKDRD